MDEAKVRAIIHDINNSLTTVLGSAELISTETPQESQTRRDAQEIATAAREAREMIRALRRELGLP